MEAIGKGKPGSADAQELRDIALEHCWPIIATREQVTAPGGLRIFTKGKGCRVTDVDGKSYLDVFAGLMYKQVGYGRKEIADAVYAQMLELTSTPHLDYHSAPAIRLSAKLAQITPGDLSRVFFTTGGGEAVETSVKIARQYQVLSGFPNRKTIIGREGEYHGLDNFTTGLHAAHKGLETLYGPFPPGIIHVPQPYCYRCPLGLEYPGCDLACAQEVEKAIHSAEPDTVAAILMTPICQQTPVVIPPPDYWPTIRSICDKYGVLLIDDEVVCGFGRTGKMFGIEHWGVSPDIMVLAKGIVSGYLPVGACITSSEINKKFDESNASFIHIVTFGGMPACCAAALTNIEILEREKLVERAVAMGEYFSKQVQILNEHPMVGDIRGTGLLWAIELVKDKKSKEKPAPDVNGVAVKRFYEAGLVTRVDGECIRFIPPLIITQEEIDESIAIFDEVIGGLEKEFL